MGKKKKAEDMNNCCAGEIHLAISRKSVVLFTAEFKTLSLRVLADFTSYKENPL